MKNRTWAVIFAALVLACLAAWRLFPGATSQTVGVYRDGELIRTIIPGSAEERFRVEGPAGENIVAVTKEGVLVESATCPDQTCVRHGLLKPDTGPIVCLPNRLVIRYLDGGGQEVDAVAGGRSLP